MRLRTALTDRLTLEWPIIQAPMGGGPTTPELVAAVSNAGGLGCIAAAYLAPERIRAFARAVRERTTRPFGINLFAPLPPTNAPPNADGMVAHVAAYHAELGLAPPELPKDSAQRSDDEFEAVLESGARVLSFTFGLLPPEAMAAARARGMILAGTATTVDEARMLEAAGVDAIVAQGAEAGAHRGTFAAPFEDALVGTAALVPQIVDAVRVPVIASGGLVDGRGLVAALALGAVAVQIGTAFLTCDESGAPEAYKAAILGAREDATRVTRVFSGRPARGIVNRFLAETEEIVARASGSVPILPYPMQNGLTRPLRRAAAERGIADFLSLWAGQGVRLARRESAAELVERVGREALAVLESLHAVAGEPGRRAGGG